MSWASFPFKNYVYAQIQKFTIPPPSLTRTFVLTTDEYALAI